MNEKSPPARVLLIDDDPQALELLGIMLEKHPMIEVVASVSDPDIAVESVLSLQPDLLFLDIQLPGKTGFDIIEEIYSQGVEPAVIFVTAFDQYTIPAIRHAACDYLMKPLNKKELSNAICNYFKRKKSGHYGSNTLSLIETPAQDKIKFSTRSGFLMIPPEEILFIEADWNYSKIHWGKGNSDTVSVNLGKIEELLSPQSFYRVSRAVIINLRYLVRVNRSQREGTLLKNGDEIQVSIPLLNIRKLERYLDQLSKKTIRP